MRSLLKTALMWGVIGIAVGLFLDAINFVIDTPRFFTDRFGSYANHPMVDFWPASIMLMGLEYAHSTTTVIEVFAAALVLNFLLYFLIGLLLTLIWRSVKKLTRSSGWADKPSA